LTYDTVCTDVRGILYINYTYTFAIENYGSQTGLNPTWGSNADHTGINSANAARALQNAAWLYNNEKPSSGAATQWAALQLAVWEVLYDTSSLNAGQDFDLGHGRFKVTSAPDDVRSTAEGYLTALHNAGTSPTIYTGYLLNPRTSQNGAIPQGLLMKHEDDYVPTSPVPEPATLIAGLFLVIPFALNAIRRSRKNTKA
jgi:hypothetical protein